MTSSPPIYSEVQLRALEGRDEDEEEEKAVASFTGVLPQPPPTSAIPLSPYRSEDLSSVWSARRPLGQWTRKVTLHIPLFLPTHPLFTFFFIPYSLHHSFIPHSSFIIHPFTIYRFTTHPIFTTHSSITHPSNNPPFMLPPDCFLQRQTRGCTAIASCGPVTCTKPLTAASSAPPTTSTSTTQTSKPEL